MQKVNIAMIDDEIGILEIALKTWAALFSEDGIEFYVTPDYKDLLIQPNIDILIVDLKMPVRSGILVARDVRKIFPSVITVVFSGYAGEFIDFETAGVFAKPDLIDTLKFVKTLANGIKQT